MADSVWKQLWSLIRASFSRSSEPAIESTASPKPSPSTTLIEPSADYVSAFEPFVGPLGDLKKSPIIGRKQLEAAFGKHIPSLVDGLYVSDPLWERRNMIVTVNLPLGIKKMYCHRLAAPYIREGLRRASLLSKHVPPKIGCFNIRAQRSDATKLSDHSYGIALDVADKDGQFRRYSKDIDAEFVTAMKSVGFAWGGDFRTFKDDMHFSLRW